VISITAFVCGLFVFGTIPAVWRLAPFRTRSRPGNGFGLGLRHWENRLHARAHSGRRRSGWHWSVARICVVNGLAGLVGAIVLMALKCTPSGRSRDRPRVPPLPRRCAANKLASA